MGKQPTDTHLLDIFTFIEFMFDENDAFRRKQKGYVDDGTMNFPIKMNFNEEQSG